MRVQSALLLLLAGEGLALRMLAPKMSGKKDAPKEKVPVWIYQDFGAGHTYSGDANDKSAILADLCKETWTQHIDSEKFSVNFVNAQNIKEYLPNIPEEFFRMYDGAKSDFIRASMIAEHGGVYLDGDIALRDDLDTIVKNVEPKGVMFYESPGQKCSRDTYTSNFMAGQKGNPLSVLWYNEIVTQLKSKCEHDTSTDAKMDEHNGICCYHPNGEPRKECHVPWGAISAPKRIAEYSPFMSFKMKEKSRSWAQSCIANKDGFGASDDTGLMYWSPLVDGPDDDARGDKHKQSCWLADGALECDGEKGFTRMDNFLKRTGYHMYRMLNWEDTPRTRDDVISGKHSQLVGGYLFRNLLLGEDFLDHANTVREDCYQGKAGVTAKQTSDLTFIHIPRTGGSTIEDCTKNDPNEKWGVADKDHFQGLQRLAEKGVNAGKGNPSTCYRQHVPPTFMKEEYADKETFCVVRSPYTRMISQFGFARAFYKDVSDCSKESLNIKLLKDLTKVKEGNIYHSDCHYLPQAAFVYGIDGETGTIQTDTTSCQNILHFENLSDEFNDLADSHGYPYHLNSVKRNGNTRSPKDCGKLTEEDLSPEVLSLIEEVYADDFQLLNFPKRDFWDKAFGEKIEDKAASALLQNEDKTASKVISCESIAAEGNTAGATKESKALFTSTQDICSNEKLAHLMDATVDPEFKGNYAKYYGKDGWTNRAFINYLGFKPEALVDSEAQSAEWIKESEALIDSVHKYSAKPVIVHLFGEHGLLPTGWTSERWPQLVVYHSAGVPKDGSVKRQSFNFNKMRAMIQAKVRTGIQLDSDQFIWRHTDYLFKRTEEEVTPSYPYPILPVHWMSRDNDPNFPDHPYEVYDFLCEECPKRTMRWAQAHPTWTFNALPFVGKWLNKAWTVGKMYGQDFGEDEDILNLGLWEAGVDKQWCKFDIAEGDFNNLLKRGPNGYGKHLFEQHYEVSPQFEDPKFFPTGIPTAFITGHAAKNSTETLQLLERLETLDGKDIPVYQYHKKGFANFRQIQKQDPSLKCIL